MLPSQCARNTRTWVIYRSTEVIVTFDSLIVPLLLCGTGLSGCKPVCSWSKCNWLLFLRAILHVKWPIKWIPTALYSCTFAVTFYKAWLTGYQLLSDFDVLQWKMFKIFNKQKIYLFGSQCYLFKWLLFCINIM